MKTMKSIFMMAAAIAAVSCAQEIMPEGVTGNTGNTVNVELQPMTFSAISSDESKAVLDNRSIQWQSDDAISVFDGSGNRKFTTTDNGSKATFEGLAAVAEEYYAIYPYQENAVFTATGTVNGSDFENYISMTIPTEQTATAGSFDPKAFLSISKVDAEGNLRFNNLLGLVQFKLADAANVASVTLSGNNSEQLAGDIYAYYTAEGNQMNTYGAARSKLVTLKGEFVADTDYYFAVRPCAFEQGLTISVEYKDGETVTRKYLSSTKAPSEELTAGSMMKLGTLDNLKEGTPNDLYVAYQHGFDLTFGDQVINKATFGEANLVKTGETVSTSGVHFVDSDAKFSAKKAKIAVIGRYADKRSILKYSAICYVDGTEADDDLFLIANIDFQTDDKVNETSYLLTNGQKINFENVIFDNCRIDMKNKYFIQISGNKNVDNVQIVNCDCKISNTSSPWFAYCGAGTKLNLVFKNNIIWNSDDTASNPLVLLYTKKNIGNVVVDQNTFVNVYPPKTNGYFDIKTAGTFTIDNVTFTNNLFYLPNLAGYINVINNDPVGTQTYENNGTYVGNGAAAGLQMLNNEGFATNRKGVNPFTTYDLENGIFIEETKYGATR